MPPTPPTPPTPPMPPTPPTPPAPGAHGHSIPEPRTHLAVYFTGGHAVTADLGLDGVADADGHVITGAVFRRDGAVSPVAPLSVRVSHGCAPATAAAMLRKTADLIERAPGLLSGRPGRSARRGPDGSAIERQITVEALLAQAEALRPDLRDALFDALDRLRAALSEDEPSNE